VTETAAEAVTVTEMVEEGLAVEMAAVEDTADQEKTAAASSADVNVKMVTPRACLAVDPATHSMRWA